ncbi:MAG: hypothetical protein V3U80_01410 [Flavobacteriaceae bacterium]
MTNSKIAFKGFKAITIIAILWNIMGAYSFYYHTNMPVEEIAKLPIAEQALYQNIPQWKIIAFFIATIGGLLGSVLLFLKKKLSIIVLILSLIGVFVSFYYDFFKTNLIEVYGNGSVILPITIALIAIFLVWYARKADKAGFLS